MRFVGIVLAALMVTSPALAVDPVLPDPILTPGVWNDPPTPLPTLCVPGYTTKVRHVTKAMKNAVFQEYGYNPRSIKTSDYEIDHLVSLELDGRNDIRNLWPQSYKLPLNAHHKDVLENLLKREVCSGKLPLRQAQEMISKDWVAAYKQFVLHGQPSVEATINE